MELQDLIKLETSKNEFYPLLKNILNDNEITEANFEQKVKEYKISKNISHLEKRLLDLLLYLNPKKENFKSDLNRKLIINILKYLKKIKESKNSINEFKDNKIVEENKNSDKLLFDPRIMIEELNEDEKRKNETRETVVEKGEKITEIIADKIIELCSKIFNEDKLLRILFNDISDLSNKEEYLEMLLLFLPEKETQQILKAIKDSANGENKKGIIELFQNIFIKINLKTKIGYQYLKDVLLEFVKDKNNIIDAIKELDCKYIIRNNMLRCIQCFNLPCFSINSEGIINISYKCEHIKSIKNEKIQEIIEHKFKCKCNELLLESNINYLCSKCKNIFCSLCLQKHFEACATIFFIPINEIDIWCCQHYAKYEAYCGVCEINLCEKCCQEHYHYVEKEKDKVISRENITKLNDIIKKDIKNDKNVLCSIENILHEKIYQYNFQFLHFARKIIGNDIKNNCKFFEEFFGQEFQKYYNYMIKEIEQGNYYFLKVLADMKKNYYKKAKMNQDYLIFFMDNAFNNLKNQIISNNGMKLSLLSTYFKIIYDLEVQKKMFDYENDIKKLLFIIEENNILLKLILKSGKVYQQELLKLIDRSIAESILIYIIEKYPSYFKKLDLNLEIYDDIEKYFKNEPEKFKRIKNNNKEKIDKLISDQNNNKDGSSNKIIFEKSITVGKTTISVDELNQMLEFLFYKIELRSLITHQKDTNASISPNPHEYKVSKENVDLNEVKNKIEKLLKTEFMKKSFNNSIKPKYLFDCLFESKFKTLVNCSNNVEMDNKIDSTLNNILTEMNGMEKNEKIFDNYTERIKRLEELYKTIKEKNDFSEKNINTPKELEEFFKRFDKLLDDEAKCLPFLYRLNENEYETSVTGENYVFFSLCLDFAIKKIALKIKEKISDYQKLKEHIKILIKSKNEILFLLSNLNQRLEIINEFEFENIIDSKKITEYVKKEMNDSITEEINLKVVRGNLEKLVTSKLNWAASKNCNLTTLLFLKQNND